MSVRHFKLSAITRIGVGITLSYLVKKWGSIAAAILLCIVLSVVYFANPADMKVAQYEIYVPYGKRQKVVLPDGTKVILNAGSYMKYPRQFGKEDRYVHFKGEA